MMDGGLIKNKKVRKKREEVLIFSNKSTSSPTEFHNLLKFKTFFSSLADFLFYRPPNPSSSNVKLFFYPKSPYN